MKVTGVEHQGVSVQAERKPTGVGAAAREDPKLWKACQSFEALFMGYLVKSMEKTLPQGTLSGSGMPEMMFQQVMGSALSEGGGIGMAEVLYRDLLAKQPEPEAEDGEGVSLQDYLTEPVGKENNDEASSR